MMKKNALLIASLFITVVACKDSGSGSSSSTSAIDARCLSASSGEFHAGSGSSLSPYLLCNATEWNKMKDYCAANAECDGTHFVVGAPITFGNLNTTTANLSALTAADNTVNMIEFFRGNIDGKNHLLKGIVLIERGNAKPTGLISVYDSLDGYIRNIKMSHSYFEGEALTAPFIGVTYASTEKLVIENIEFSKVVVTGDSVTAGLIGVNQGIGNEFSLKNISMDIKIKGLGQSASLVGIQTRQGKTENVRVKGEIEGVYDSGGIFGQAYASQTIENVKVFAPITSNGGSAGGVIGQAGGGATFKIKNIEVDTSLFGDGFTAGIVASANAIVEVSNIKVRGTFTSAGSLSASMGGILGQSTSIGSFVTKADVDVSLTGNEFIGGAFGKLQSPLTFDDSIVKSRLAGTSGNCGGITGLTYGSSSFDTINVNTQITCAGKNVGGLIGTATEASFSNITATAAISMNANENVGGVSGLVTSVVSFDNVTVTSTLTQLASGPTTYTSLGGVFGHNVSNNFSMNDSTINTTINFRAGATLTQFGGYAGYTVANHTLTNNQFNVSAVSNGALNSCTDVNSFIGKDFSNPANDPTPHVSGIDITGLDC